jgi:single-strand DNA-binding protein
MNFNKVILVGNLTRDPEIRVMPSGQNVASFGMATNRFYTDKNSGQRQQKTEFHNIIIFGRMADTAGQYLKKGSIVLIEGRLQTRDWLDAAGVKHYKTEIVTESMQLGPRPSGTTGNYAPAQNFNPKPVTKPENSPSTTKPMAEPDIPIIEENDDIDVKNIPF